jgi:small subunit ribosomal protein S17
VPDMSEQTQPQAVERSKTRQEKVGKVISSRMEKTIVVEVSRRVPHPLYRRVVQRRKKFYAHDESNQCQVGDVVRIVESRPFSRLKRWRLAEVLRHAKGAGLVEPVDLPAGPESPEPATAPATGPPTGPLTEEAEQ